MPLPSTPLTLTAIGALSALLTGCAPRADRDALRHQRIAAITERHLELHSVTTCLSLHAEGEALFFGRGGCSTCHRIDDRGQRFTGPNLGLDPDCRRSPDALTRQDPYACLPMLARARERRPELHPFEYAVESILDPDHLVVPGYARGVMKRVDEAPLNLTDHEILSLAVFVSSPDPSLIPHPELGSREGLARATEHFGPCRESRDRRIEAHR